MALDATAGEGVVMRNDLNLIRLEGSLERLVENAFASLFRKPVSAHDIAVKLARSMAANTRLSADLDPRPFAPDRYIITLNPDLYTHFQQVQADTIDDLVEQLTDLAARLEYRLNDTPQLAFAADARLRAGDLSVESSHSEVALPSTAMMKAVQIPTAQAPATMHLLIGDRSVRLMDSVINIGRSDENTIVLDDSYVSRHHIQLRLRYGGYLLFDAQSKSGTFVNDIAVREHQLQSGDVIRIGSTSMIYVVDNAPAHHSSGNTDHLDPVQF